MKKHLKSALALMLALLLAMAALTGCSGSKAQSVEGTYTFEYTGDMGTDKFTLALDAEGGAILTIEFIVTDVFNGTYTVNENGTVDVKGLTSETAQSPHPGLWAQFIDPDSGDCNVTLDKDNGTFTFTDTGKQGGIPDDAEITEPVNEPSTSTGDYTMTFDGNFGEETFTMTLNEDGTCRLTSSNQMMGPWDGTYTAEGTHITVEKLENPDAQMGKTPDLWANWFEVETGACELDLNEDGTFTFVEREGAEGGQPGGFPGGDPGDLPPEDGYTTWSNEPYGSEQTQTFNGMMKNGPGARPVVIVVPGGAFRFVDGGRYQTIAETLCEQNYLVIQLNYTVGAGTYPQAIVDVKTAIQYVVDNADVLHADVNDITVMGCSAGGYLAAMSVLTDADDFKSDDNAPAYTYQVKNLVEFFGATQWMTDDLHADVGAQASESEWVGSDVSAMSADERAALDPLTYLDKNDVTKVWISHGTGDTTMPILNSEKFYNGLKAVLGEDNVHYEVIEGAGHEDAAFYTADNFALVVDYIK